MFRNILLLLLATLIFSCSKPVEPEIPIITDVVVFEHGDLFSKTLEQQTKISSQESFKLLSELKKHTNINKCLPGDFYEITYSQDQSTWTDFKYFPKGKFYYEIIKSSDNVISSQKLELNTIEQVYEKAGTVESSLWVSMSNAGVEPEAILGFANVFAWQVDFLTDTRNGDKFKVIYSTETLEKKGTVLSTKILAGEYITGNTNFIAIAFNNGKEIDGYFDENGKSLRSMFLKAPLQFKRISSYFTKRRFHPILKKYRAHEGIDYAAPVGTPVSAIADGTVTKAQYSGGYGNLVVLKHANGYETSYGHLSKYGKGIKKGVRVKQGQVVGYVGSTGLSTGPHLDFRMKLNKKFINFLAIKMPPTQTLKGKDKEDFNVIKDNLIERLNNISF